jgi:hypothetical protein
MRAKLLMSVVLTLALMAFFGVAMAQEAEKADKAEKADHAYVGAKKCKGCHKKSGIFESWETSTHATAWDGLTDEEKADENIKKFYTTGTNAKGVELTGVQCEACHGAGADYKKPKVMKDRDASLAAGMIVPTEETCKSCHNDKAPAKVAAVAKDFDYAKALTKGVHTMPAAAEGE